MVDGNVILPTSTTARGFADLNNNGGTTTINTTGSLAVDVQATLSAASQTVSGTVTTVEVLN